MSSRKVTVTPASYGLYPYEHELLKREVRAITGSELDERGTVDTESANDLRRLAFAERVEISKTSYPTIQHRREAPSPGTRPKNSTYGPHGIHRYKGKFYPQLAKSLLNASAAGPGVIFDPFGGSGTVVTEAVLDGHHGVSIDCNPVAVRMCSGEGHPRNGRSGSRQHLSGSAPRPRGGSGQHDSRSARSVPSAPDRRTRVMVPCEGAAETQRNLAPDPV